MMRGTNLLLAGRLNEALECPAQQYGRRITLTRSIAHDLLSTVKWYSGNPSRRNRRGGDRRATFAEFCHALGRSPANRLEGVHARGQRWTDEAGS